MESFNVINYDINRQVFEPYDVMPYLVHEYQEAKEKPVTRDEFKSFVEKAAHYQYWSRCEYEIILVDWPCQKHEEKWDVYGQVMINLDIVTDILMKNVLT